jgi:hypothetical protein
MEEVQTLSEDLRLVIHLDPAALTGAQTAQAPLQLLPNIVCRQDSCRGGLWMLHSGFRDNVRISLLTLLSQQTRLSRRVTAPREREARVDQENPARIG